MSDKPKKPSESEVLKELRKKIEEKEKEFLEAQEEAQKSKKSKKSRKSGQHDGEDAKDEVTPEDIQHEIRRLQDLRNLLEQDELQFQSSWINALEEIMAKRIKEKPFEWRVGVPLCVASAILGYLGPYIVSLFK